MSPKLPAVTAKDLVRVAQKMGFVLRRQRGSHAIYVRDSDKARIVIPMHSGTTIKRKTFRGIIQDMKLNPEEFANLV